MPCLDENTVVALVEGRIPPEDRADVEAHLDQCADCREVLAGFGKAFARMAKESTPTPIQPAPDQRPDLAATPSDPKLASGARIGRYVLLHELGTGGMGVVFAAYDRQLNRNVALKQLRLSEAESPELGARRLRREAQAMARLHHPNVVAVHDLLEHEGGFFLAMELVEGTTLAHWLVERERSWQEILGMFLQAGRGLAAAHSAGVIHRDFKPENVLIGRDGVARVADFGLARELGQETSLSLRRSHGAPKPVVGTPAYMAPEQWANDDVDARADQFSFCAAIYLALFRQHPFGGAGPAEIEAAVRGGKVRPPPSGDVPGKLRRALIKGLSLRARDRFATMDTLLDALGTNASKTQRRLAWAGALVLVALIAVATGRLWTTHRRQARCGALEQTFDAVWNPPREQGIARAFAATRVPDANTALEGVTRALASQAKAWRSVAAGVCAQEKVAASAQEACLGDQLEGLNALLSAFEHPDVTVVQHAVSAAFGLPDARFCEHVAVWRPRGSSRAAPARAEDGSASESLAQAILDAQTRVHVGKPAEAISLAEDALGRARTGGDLSAQARAGLSLARAKSLLEGVGPDAVSAAFDAALAAEATDQDATAIDAWILLVQLDASRGDLREAHRFAQLAQAELLRGRAAPTQAIALQRELADLAMSEGNPTGALTHLESALTLAAQLGRADTPEALELRAKTAEALLASKRTASAVTVAKELVARAEQLYGARHPQLGRALQTLGQIQAEAGQGAAAQVSFRRALELSNPSDGADPLQAPELRADLAPVLFELGEQAQARALAQQALAELAKVRPADHPIEEKLERWLAAHPIHGPATEAR